jgi:hypothetical protein
MPEVTFRDFAAAVMSNDLPGAARVLETLLALDGKKAAAAAGFFKKEMGSGGQAFMMKAMGLRMALTEGRNEDVVAVLTDCFGLRGADLDRAASALRARYMPSA